MFAHVSQNCLKPCCMSLHNTQMYTCSINVYELVTQHASLLDLLALRLSAANYICNLSQQLMLLGEAKLMYKRERAQSTFYDLSSVSGVACSCTHFWLCAGPVKTALEIDCRTSTFQGDSRSLLSLLKALLSYIARGSRIVFDIQGEWI